MRVVEEGDLRNVAVVLPPQPEYPGEGRKERKGGELQTETRGSHVPMLTSLLQPTVWLGFTPGKRIHHDIPIPVTFNTAPISK